MVKKDRNVTGIVLAVIYCFVLFEILIDAPPGEAPNHPLWVYSMIPLGAVVITSLFDYVIKFDLFDFFKKRNRKMEWNQGD
ncbi:hypothetical protein M5X00_06765 [Paenibacillus alvei]|uniref:Uncharacterized protein n=1 Tax=Paenibacillus alvei TaxID=44250 RepID=A0ABT4GWR4_PAEAL|nr:hypothetical protein [Paenibacillus alvei]MCY9705045.1 hypothetical protein [Paenibacillus alvei]MCY9734721.1 hypothetical protein [Paenibacillus alvei]MCY9753956.1 hypothetical protein [Paenibacillus alvei]MCY9761134.1 hypothetical protein [Paenibacillus alvei]MCY9767035.1 hypothetical protein [Paenibacillus alvei]